MTKASVGTASHSSPGQAAVWAPECRNPQCHNQAVHMDNTLRVMADARRNDLLRSLSTLHGMLICVRVVSTGNLCDFNDVDLSDYTRRWVGNGFLPNIESILPSELYISISACDPCPK